MTQINVNTATAQDLDAIPQLKGHGFEIIRYREDRGAFTGLQQLEEVSGMFVNADGLDDVLTLQTWLTRHGNAAPERAAF